MWRRYKAKSCRELPSECPAIANNNKTPVLVIVTRECSNVARCFKVDKLSCIALSPSKFGQLGIRSWSTNSARGRPNIDRLIVLFLIGRSFGPDV
jgi:hypothetical protein